MLVLLCSTVTALSCYIAIASAAIVPLTSSLKSESQWTTELRMPGVHPSIDDDYICIAVPAARAVRAAGIDVERLMGDKNGNSNHIYVTGFEGLATEDRAHHIILQRCRRPSGGPAKPWFDSALHFYRRCLHHATCSDTKIMYAWARNAPPTVLPADVGFELDIQSDYLVMQVHYAHPLKEADRSGLRLHFTDVKPNRMAGVLLMVRTGLTIPPRKRVTHGDINCALDDDLTLFAFRTHAHSLGSVITGYHAAAGPDVPLSLNEIARGDPQQPQTFYPMTDPLAVRRGDYLHARCTYDSSNRNRPTYIGGRAGDEMCNLYVMFHTSDWSVPSYTVCSGERFKVITDRLPADSDVTIAELRRMKTGGQSGVSFSRSRRFYAEDGDVVVDEVAAEAAGDRAKGNGRSSAIDTFVDAVAQAAADRIAGERAWRSIHGRHWDAGSARHVPLTADGRHLIVDAHWQLPDDTKAKIGVNLASVAIDIHGQVQIFHRADRRFDENSFDAGNRFVGHVGPIASPTVATLNATGFVVHEWGAHIFWLPHFITVDAANNVWLTDVGRHQILKFSPYGYGTRQRTAISTSSQSSDAKADAPKPLIELGERLVPGSDKRHFCKPTSVAVAADGKSFFVADGYCNARIIKFSVSLRRDLHEIVKWDFEISVDAMDPGLARRQSKAAALSPYHFNVPHSLTLVASDDDDAAALLCVADRENGRIPCFTAASGHFVEQVGGSRGLPASTVYAVAYAPAHGGRLYAIGGPEPFAVLNNRVTQGYVIAMGGSGSNGDSDSPSGSVLATFNVPGGLQLPHDVAVSLDGRVAYVVELHGGKVWRLLSDDVAPSGSTTSVSAAASRDVSVATLASDTLQPAEMTRRTERASIDMNNNDEAEAADKATSTAAAVVLRTLSVMSLVTTLLCFVYWLYRRWRIRGHCGSCSRIVRQYRLRTSLATSSAQSSPSRQCQQRRRRRRDDRQPTGRRLNAVGDSKCDFAPLTQDDEDAMALDVTDDDTHGGNDDDDRTDEDESSCLVDDVDRSRMAKSVTRQLLKSDQAGNTDDPTSPKVNTAADSADLMNVNG